MRRTHDVLLACLLLTAGCSESADSDDTGTRDDESPSGSSDDDRETDDDRAGSASSSVRGTLWTEGGILGWRLDGDPSDPIRIVDLVELPDAFAADETGVWMAYRDGPMYGADAEGDNLVGPIDVGVDGIGPDFMAMGDGEVWLARSGTETGPAVYDIENGTLTETGPIPDEFGGFYSGLVVDGDAVYALLNRGLELLEYDASSREFTQGVPLGEDPSDPSGPRGRFGSPGSLAVSSQAVWVLDADVSKLHKIDKRDLTIDGTADLSARVSPDSDNGALRVYAGEDNVYVVNPFNGSDDTDIFAIDQDSLDVSQVSKRNGEVYSGLAVNGDLLLYELVGDGTFVIDGTSGDEVAAYTVGYFLEGEPTIWVP